MSEAMKFIPALKKPTQDPSNMRDGVYVEKGVALTERFLKKNIDLVIKYADLWIAYPDLFIDLITPVGRKFYLFFYQRIFLRISIRFRYSFSTFTRAFSKSFLSILAMYLRCIFLAGSKVFICTDVLKQAVKIMREKIEEIWFLFPLLKEEIMARNMSGDEVKLTFYNRSVFDVVGVSTSARGGRRHAGILEEAATIDGTDLSEVVLPLMNIDRRDEVGHVNEAEPHQAQIYITTAGPKTTFAYEKLIELTVMSVINPEAAFVWGGSYRIPVYHGLLSKRFVEENRLSATFREDSFAREYVSVWTGGSSDSWVDLKRIGKYRELMRAEKKYTIPVSSTEGFYLISVDVARYDANSAIWVMKCLPHQDNFRINIVYGEVINDTHFNDQANRIKELVAAFNAREVVIDGNGPGIGLVDMMVIPTTDGKTGIVYPAYGVMNDPNYLSKQDPTAPRIVYNLRAGAANNSDIHSNFYVMLTSGRCRFLATEFAAKTRLLSTGIGQRMSPLERAKFLMPYENTTRLFEEIANLRLKHRSGNSVEVEQISRRLNKDRFSSFEYGLWRIKMIEDEFYKKQRRKTRSMKEFFKFTPKDAGRPGGRR